MKEIDAARFLQEFQGLVIHFQGAIAASLLIFWLTALWEPLKTQALAGGWGTRWLGFCLLFGLAITGICIADWGMDYALFATSIGLSIGLALAHPTAAVCLLTSLLFLRPWEMLSDNDYFAILPKLCITLCFGHILLKMAREKKLSLNWTRASTLLLAFAAWVYVTTFKAPDPAFAQARFFDTLFKSVFLYFTVKNVLSTRKDLRTLIGTLILTFLGVGLICIYQTIETVDIAAPGEDRLKGIGAFANANDIAALMVLVFPFGFVTAWNKRENPLLRALAAVLVLIALVSVYLSQSRGAALGLAAGLAVYTILRTRSRAVKAMAVGLALLSVPAYVAISSRDTGDLQGSSESRKNYIQAGISMGLHNPVLGVGYDAYPLRFENYAPNFQFEIGQRTAHNSWVLVFAETGALGLLLFAWLFVEAIRNARGAFESAPEFLFAMVSYGVAMTFLSHSYLLYPYLLYGLVEVARKTSQPATSVAALAEPSEDASATPRA
ncbi:MAG: O-antigen ligase family protein [Bdellovibrionota bacterium]